MVLKSKFLGNLKCGGRGKTAKNCLSSSWQNCWTINYLLLIKQWMWIKQLEYRKDSQAIARTDQVFIIFLYLQRLIKLDKVFPILPSFLAQLYSWLLSPLLGSSGGWGIGVVVTPKRFISAAPAPGWGSSHRNQPFMNGSKAGPFQGWPVPADLYQCGLLSMGCLWAAASFRACIAVAQALHWLQRGWEWMSVPPWLPMGWGRAVYFLLLFSTGCKESLL